MRGLACSGGEARVRVVAGGTAGMREQVGHGHGHDVGGGEGVKFGRWERRGGFERRLF